jgi:hypothetical protein
LSPKVLKFDGPSKDGRKYGRGTYLFPSVLLFLHLVAAAVVPLRLISNMKST